MVTIKPKYLNKNDLNSIMLIINEKYIFVKKQKGK